MFAFLDKLMAFVEKHYLLSFWLCLGYLGLATIPAELWGWPDWTMGLLSLPANLLSWPMAIIWWRERRQGGFAARGSWVSRCSLLPVIATSLLLLDLLSSF